MNLLTSNSFETEYSRRIINRGGEKGARKGERRTLLRGAFLYFSNNRKNYIISVSIKVMIYA